MPHPYFGHHTRENLTFTLRLLGDSLARVDETQSVYKQIFLKLVTKKPRLIHKYIEGPIFPFSGALAFRSRPARLSPTAAMPSSNQRRSACQSTVSSFPRSLPATGLSRPRGRLASAVNLFPGLWLIILLC